MQDSIRNFVTTEHKNRNTPLGHDWQYGHAVRGLANAAAWREELTPAQQESELVSDTLRIIQRHSPKIVPFLQPKLHEIVGGILSMPTPCLQTLAQAQTGQDHKHVDITDQLTNQAVWYLGRNAWCRQVLGQTQEEQITGLYRDLERITTFNPPIVIEKVKQICGL